MRMILLAAVSVLAAAPAAAAVFAVDGGFGAGSATRSTATGLDFLDLTITRGNVSEINAQLAPGGTFEGFRRATTAEVLAFWLDADVTPTLEGDGYVYSGDPAYVAAVSALMDLVGLTEASGSFDFSESFTVESVLPEGQRAAGLSRGYNRDLNLFDRAGVSYNAVRSPELPFSGDNIGNWLVRAFEVPAPAAIALFGLGALTLGFIRAR